MLTVNENPGPALRVRELSVASSLVTIPHALSEAPAVNGPDIEAQQRELEDRTVCTYFDNCVCAPTDLGCDEPTQPQCGETDCVPACPPEVPDCLSPSDLGSDEPAVEALVPDTAHVEAALTYQVRGLPETEDTVRGDIDVTFAVRPTGTALQSVPADAQEWLPVEYIETLDGARREDTLYEVPGAPGLFEVSTFRALQIPRGTLEVMNNGAWRAIDDFELQVCVATDYAPIDGQDDDQCVSIAIAVVRIPSTADGEVPRSAGASLAINKRETGEYRSWRNGVTDANLFREVWWTSGSAEQATPYGRVGRTLPGRGMFAEAGARMTTTLFGRTFNLAELYGTFNSALGGLAEAKVQASVLGISFIPNLTDQFSLGNPTLTLGQILQAARNRVRDNSRYPVSFDVAAPLVGKRVSVGPISVALAVEAFVEGGLDEDETKVELGNIPGVSATCTGGEPRNASGSHCFQRLTGPSRRLDEWKDQCRDIAPGAGLAAPLNAAEFALMLTAIDPAGPAATNYFRRPGQQPSLFDPAIEGSPYTTPDEWWLPYPFGGLSNEYILGRQTNITRSGRAVHGIRGYTRTYQAICRVPVNPNVANLVELKTTVTPFVSAGVRAVASLNLGINIEIVGTLALITIRLPVFGAAALGVSASGSVYLQLSTGLDIELELLSGSLEVKFDARIFSYSTTVFEWDGIKFNAELLPRQVRSFVF